MFLRPTDVTDLDVFLGWVHDEEAMVLWSGPTFSWPLDRLHLESYLTDEHRRYWTGIDEATSAVVAHASLLMDGERSWRLGFVILDPSRRGEGPGRELVTRLMATVFETKTERGIVKTCGSAAKLLFSPAVSLTTLTFAQPYSRRTS